MKSERTVVGCILAVMVCLTGAMFFTGAGPDPRALDQPVGPSRPMPPAPKVAAAPPVTSEGDDVWVPAPLASPSPSSVSIRLTPSSTVTTSTPVTWSNLAGGGGQSITSAPGISTFAGPMRVRFSGAENIVTLDFPSELTADADGDGELTAADLAAFTRTWEAMGPDADFNGDGFVDAFDMAAFVDAFESGESRTIARAREFANIQFQISNVTTSEEIPGGEMVLRTVLVGDETK